MTAWFLRRRRARRKRHDVAHARRALRGPSSVACRESETKPEFSVRLARNCVNGRAARACTMPRARRAITGAKALASRFASVESLSTSRPSWAALPRGVDAARVTRPGTGCFCGGVCRGLGPCQAEIDLSFFAARLARAFCARSAEVFAMPFGVTASKPVS